MATNLDIIWVGLCLLIQALLSAVRKNSHATGLIVIEHQSSESLNFSEPYSVHVPVKGVVHSFTYSFPVTFLTMTCGQLQLYWYFYLDTVLTKLDSLGKREILTEVYCAGKITIKNKHQIKKEPSSCKQNNLTCSQQYLDCIHHVTEYKWCIVSFN